MDPSERKMCANKSWLGIAFAPSKLNYFDRSWLSSVQIFVERRPERIWYRQPQSWSFVSCQSQRITLQQQLKLDA
jgi:hypothetical protein